MATAARSARSANKTNDAADVPAFDPIRLRAPFVLRCAALSIDYITLVILPALWLVVSRLWSDGGSGVLLGFGIWLAAGAIFVINFLLLPLLRGQSIGKMVTGLTILQQDGRPAGLGKLLVRNSLGYLLTVLSGGLGFLVAAFNDSGRTLHDLVAGTIVIKGRRI